MSSPDVDEAADAPPEVDEAREGIIETLRSELGSGLVGHHLIPGTDVWVRVDRDVWRETASVLRGRLHMRFFGFLSAIDWMPSPYGREMDSEVDRIVHGADAADVAEMETGVAGGETRFQLLARVVDVSTNLAVTIKSDLPDDDLRALSWIPVYAGANWHEREAWEMFGIHFDEHPDIRHIYLPGAFEGNPLRKDYPLLARRVKPWPGIVDVEAMPGDDDDDDDPEGAAS